MKKSILILIAVMACTCFVGAKDLTGIKIYINPGHGGWDGANDRNVATINYPLKVNEGDTLGFWESISNLTKGLYLRDLLQAQNASVTMSRVLNRDIDDRALSSIVEEANAGTYDAFLSIHSNAVGANSGTNYLLMLYQGTDASELTPNSKAQATAAWTELMKNQLSFWSHYTSSTNIRGDWSFYGNTSGLGVLRGNNAPGFLSEGSFHDYKPETHRLQNTDYRRLEAIHFFDFYCGYFGADKRTTGTVAGFVKGKNEPMFAHAQYVFKAGTHDQYLPLNGSEVTLMNAAGDSLMVYNVDELYNGIFVFYNITPGKYKLRARCNEHIEKIIDIEVKAAEISQSQIFLNNVNEPEPVIIPDNYPAPVQEAGVLPMNQYKFKDSGSGLQKSWMTGMQFKRVIHRDTALYMLTQDGRIFKAKASTLDSICQIKTAGAVGTIKPISDIAFSADGYLMACNKDTVALPEAKGRYFRVYTWDDDNSDLKLYFETQSQGNWGNAVIGETFTITGPRWKSIVYAPAVTTGSSKQIRICAFNKESLTAAVGYKYMLNTTEYTEALWGTNFLFTISPRAADCFILTGNNVLPTEYQFDFTKADRDPLVKKGTFATSDGYPLIKTNGANFFMNAGHSYMAAPMANADRSGVGVVLFDIHEGLDKAKRVSEKLSPTGMKTTPVEYMAAFGRAKGYDITLTAFAQDTLMNYVSYTDNVTANIYASELKATQNGTGYDLSFTLNENASNVDLILYRDGNLDQTITKGAMNKGRNTIYVETSNAAIGQYTWGIKATAEQVMKPTKVSNDALPVMMFFSPRGVAVDNTFESPFFGRVYASETGGGATSGRTTKDGLYILDAALTDITNQGANSYAGNITWGSGSSPMRCAVAPNGEVFLTDWSDTNSGVWVMNPSDPNATFRQVFGGTRNGDGLSSNGGVNIHGSISHCYVTGTGEETKLFTFDEDYTDAVATNPGNLLQYNIGTSTEKWITAPSAIVYNDALANNLQQNMNSSIAPDGRGGWFISQYRASDAESIPSLIHVNAAGKVDFNSGKDPYLIVNSLTGGMAVNHDGSRLAMGCSNEVKIFDITYDVNNAPTLKRVHVINPAMGTNTCGISFDRAGNIYVISNTSERLGVYALPKGDNSFTTPAPTAQGFQITQGVGIEDTRLPELSFFPNPARDEIMIITSGRYVEQVSIFDLSGRMVKRIELNTTNNTPIQVGDLQAGSYIIRINNTTMKLIKR